VAGEVDVSVIVLTYNSTTTLASSLRSIEAASAGLSSEIIVVDNASTDGSPRLAEELGYPPLATGANLGFAAGCNRGAERATGRSLLFVNPDAQLDPGCIRALLRASTYVDGPLGGRARTVSGSYDQRAALGRPRLRGAVAFAFSLDRVARGSALLDPEHGPRHPPDVGPAVAVHAVSGAVLMISRDLWFELGGFDERFFLYGEDVDLCLRAAAIGRGAHLVPEAAYTHVGGVSSGGSSSKSVYLFAGKVELYRRHLTPAAASVAVRCLQVGVALRGLPFWLGLPRLSQHAAPWAVLFEERRRWRGGFSGLAVLQGG
jgi:N-acetylglucosaminyl-diphospho-decaprenol L-rhamnosyltransferase